MTGHGETADPSEAAPSPAEPDRPESDGGAGPWSTAAAPLVALAGWCGFVWYIFWQGATRSPLLWSDSTSYAAVAGHPLLSTGFWAGQRPVLVPLVMKLVGQSLGFTVVQCLLAVLAWGFLAFTVGRLVEPGWRRVAAVWIVLGFATSTPITLWNRSVLSESLSLSTLALVLAATIWAARRLSWPRVAGVVLAGLAFASSRDAQVWTVGLLGLVVAVVAVVSAVRQKRFPRRLVALAVGLLLAAAATGWVVVHTGRTRANVADVFYVRIFPFPSRVAWFARHGMPAAAAIDRSMAATAPPVPGAAKVFNPEDPRLAGEQAALENWIMAHGQSTYLLWLISHPAFLITEPLARPEQAYNFAGGQITFYADPHRIDSPLSVVLWPAWWWLLPLTVIGVVPAAVSGRWRERSWRVLVLLGALGLVTMLIAWQGDGQEVTRHTVEGFAVLRACVLIVAVVGLLSVVPRRPAPRQRRGAHLAR